MDVKCEGCRYYRPDYGMWTMTGWTGDGSDGKCRYEPVQVPTTADNCCNHWESKHAGTKKEAKP